MDVSKWRGEYEQGNEKETLGKRHFLLNFEVIVLFALLIFVK
jgi:hypothetical protein